MPAERPSGAVYHSKQEQRRQRLAERERILERIGTGEALTSFLRTEEGRRLLGNLNEPEKKPGSGNLGISIIGLLTSGVIALAVGAGFFYAAPRVQDTLLVPGGIIGGVGIGCLVAAIIEVNEKSVRVLLLRARERMGKVLADQGIGREEEV